MEKQPYWLKFASLGFLRTITADADGGGDDDADDDEPDDDDADDADDDESEDEKAKKDLGDKGQKAIDRMKARVKAERAKRIAAEQERDAAKNTDEAEKQRKAAEAAADERANRKIVSAEIRAAAAAASFNDPKDALAHIDISQFDVDDDGEVDQDDIAEAIKDLLAKKPYLAAQGGGPKPDLSQGGGTKGIKKTGVTALGDYLESKLNG